MKKNMYPATSEIEILYHTMCFPPMKTETHSYQLYWLLLSEAESTFVSREHDMEFTTGPFFGGCW